MSNWGEHVAMDGVSGILPDLPLAMAIVISKGSYIGTSSRLYFVHRCLHSWWFAGLVFCWYLATKNNVLLAVAKHIALDHLTHKHGWLDKDKGNDRYS